MCTCFGKKRNKPKETYDLMESLLPSDDGVIRLSHLLSFAKDDIELRLDDYYHPTEYVSFEPINGVTLLSGTPVDNIEYVVNKIMIDGIHVCVLYSSTTYSRALTTVMCSNCVYNSEPSVSKQTKQKLFPFHDDEEDHMLEINIVSGLLRHYTFTKYQGRIRVVIAD